MTLNGGCGSAALSRSGCRLKPAFQAIWAALEAGRSWAFARSAVLGAGGGLGVCGEAGADATPADRRAAPASRAPAGLRLHRHPRRGVPDRPGVLGGRRGTRRGAPRGSGIREPFGPRGHRGAPGLRARRPARGPRCRAGGRGDRRGDRQRHRYRTPGLRGPDDPPGLHLRRGRGDGRPLLPRDRGGEHRRGQPDRGSRSSARGRRGAGLAVWAIPLGTANNVYEPITLEALAAGDEVLPLSDV